MRTLKAVWPLFSSYVVGLLFGLGLLISEMINPAKVLAFLDLAGAWDPSLALVMAAAVMVSIVGYRLARQRNQAFSGAALQIPSKQGIDRSLIAGSMVFGIGWGLIGICPGPALALGGLSFAAELTTQQISSIVAFLAAMLVGVVIFEVLQIRRTS